MLLTSPELVAPVPALAVLLVAAALPACALGGVEVLAAVGVVAFAVVAGEPAAAAVLFAAVDAGGLALPLAGGLPLPFPAPP